MVQLAIVIVRNKRKLILQERHNDPYTELQAYIKILVAVRKEYFWIGKKRILQFKKLDAWNAKGYRLNIFNDQN